MEKKSVMVDGYPVWYREKGQGNPVILILPGWGGPTDDYFQLQDKLVEIGYRVVLPDFPGLPGKTPSRLISPTEWDDWVDEFVQHAVGERFMIVAHSGSTWIALQYILEKHPLCLGAILFGPGLVSPWQSVFWRVVEIPFRFLIPFVFPNMKWVRNRETWATAHAFLSVPKKHTQPKVRCLVLLGKKDPVRFFFTGWKRIECQMKEMALDHSPQLRAVDKLVDEIDNFIRRGLKMR